MNRRLYLTLALVLASLLAFFLLRPWSFYIALGILLLVTLPGAVILIIYLYSLHRYLIKITWQWFYLACGARKHFWNNDKVGVLFYGSRYKGLVKQKLYPLWGDNLILLHYRAPQSVEESNLPPRYARYLQEHLGRYVQNRLRWPELPLILLLKGKSLEWEIITVEWWLPEVKEKDWEEMEEVREINKKFEDYKERFCYW